MRPTLRIALISVGVLTLVASSIAPSRDVVHADPITPDLTAYRLRVPVDVLSGATASGTLSQAEQVALLANTVNGIAPTFAPPVAPPVPVQAPAGSGLAGGGAATPVIAGLAGFLLTTEGFRAIGVDYQGGLCPGATQGSPVDGFLAAITLTDCTQWRISTELEARMNLDAMPLANPAAIGSTSCDAYGRCAQIYAFTTPSPQMPSHYCLRHASGPLFTATSFGGDGSARIPLAGMTSPFDRDQWWGGRAYKMAEYDVPPGCPSISGTQLSSFTVSMGGTPLRYWAADAYAAWDQPVSLPEPFREDPTRTIRCVVSYAGGMTKTGVTQQFTLGGGRIPRPNCPAPDGVAWQSQYLVSIDLWLDSTTTASVQIGHIEISPESRLWYQTSSATCHAGNCALDLRHNGTSCFEGTDCIGWIADPARDSDYSCWYADTQIDLAGCYIYGPTFQPTGPAYGDFTTGANLTIRTTLSEEDKLAIDLMERGWRTWGPTPAGYQTGIGDEAVAARLVARQCVALNVARKCRELPIFSPGDNVKEAARHDLDAMLGLGSTTTHAPPVLTRGTPSVLPQWYLDVSPCIRPYDGQVLNCDEYPYFSTTQAGPPLASIRLIDRDDNVNEGKYLQGFYSECGVTGDFVVIPVPTPGPSRITRTEFWCD